jgi:DNA polymerase-3 subunit epsilon
MTNALTFPIADGPFAVLDFETNALEPGHNAKTGAIGRVLEVAILTLDADLNLVDCWDTLINPGPGIGVGATHIHGITEDDLVDAPDFETVADDIYSRLTDRVVVAHNARFDLGFLDYESRLIGTELPVLASVCTRDLARNLARIAGSSATQFRLTDCCERYGIAFPEDVQHHSVTDTAATAALFRMLLQQAQELGVDVNTTAPQHVIPHNGAVGTRKSRSDQAALTSFLTTTSNEH